MSKHQLNTSKAEDVELIESAIFKDNAHLLPEDKEEKINALLKLRDKVRKGGFEGLDEEMKEWKDRVEDYLIAESLSRWSNSRWSNSGKI